MQNKTITNLSGGVNAKTNPLILKDSECEKIINYNLDTFCGIILMRHSIYISIVYFYFF
jgi:hypothetical protein